jgi:hypothetical protein
MTLRDEIVGMHFSNGVYSLLGDEVLDIVQNEIVWQTSPLPLAVRNSMINELDDWSESNGLHS